MKPYRPYNLMLPVAPRCEALIDGVRCENGAELVRLCRSHYNRQQVLLREKRTLRMATVPYFGTPSES